MTSAAAASGDIKNSDDDRSPFRRVSSIVRKRQSCHSHRYMVLNSVLMIGGASGIGRATVELFHRHGAYVVFGDVNDDEGIQFEKTLGT